MAVVDESTKDVKHQDIYRHFTSRSWGHLAEALVQTNSFSLKDELVPVQIRFENMCIAIVFNSPLVDANSSSIFSCCMECMENIYLDSLTLFEF